MPKIIYECRMGIDKSGRKNHHTLILQFYDDYKEIFNDSCPIPKACGLKEFRQSREVLYKEFNRVLRPLAKGNELKIYNGQFWGTLADREKERRLWCTPLTWWQKIGLLRMLRSKAEKLTYMTNN